MSRSVPNSPRNQHELMKSNTLPQTAVLDAAASAAATSTNNTNSGGGGGSVSASPGRRSRGASLTNFLKKLSPKLRQNSNSPVKQHKDHRSTNDVTVTEEAANLLLSTNSSPSLTDNKNIKSSQLNLRVSKEEETTTKTAVVSTLTASTATSATRESAFSSSTSHVTSLVTPLTSCGSSGSSPSEVHLTAGVCVRRTQQPPKTLNILNKIVVHPPPLEMERVKNKIASVESIGSCSLDADGTGSESSVTVDGRASSVSQRTLRSASGGAMSTPKASVNVAEINEEITSERRSITKNPSKIYMTNGHSLMGEKSEKASGGDLSVVDGELQLKKPSYIGISCSVSGYSNYSCYDSKVRKEGLRSRDNSPARLAFQPINRTVDIEIDEFNGGVTYTSCETHTSEATVLLNGETTTKTAAFAMWRASSEDGILNGGNRESRKTATKTSYTSTTSQHLSSNEALNISTTPTKSLIQQRIERLYGPGALAQVFRKQVEMKSKNIDQQKQQPEKQLMSKVKATTSSHSLDKPKTNGTTDVNHSRSSDVVPVIISNTQTKDGQMFINEMNREKDRISSMMAKSESYLDNSLVPEEAKGKIRAAVGKANLLISRKFRQFQGLCERNLKQGADEPFPTTVQDLTGFWDMVLIQVDDINKAFEAIDKAQQAGWKADETDSRHAKNGASEGKKLRKPKVVTHSKLENSDSAAAKSRAEARRKLMELKCKGRQQKSENVKDDSSNGIEIYVADDRVKLN